MSYANSKSNSPELATPETHALISSDRVDGTPVFNLQQEKLGRIHSLMIDKATGEVPYAILSFGGILGIGDNYYPIPWRKLQYDVALGGYVVDIDRRSLDGAPQYAPESSTDWMRPEFGRAVDDYYGDLVI